MRCWGRGRANKGARRTRARGGQSQMRRNAGTRLDSNCGTRKRIGYKEGREEQGRWTA